MRAGSWTSTMTVRCLALEHRSAGLGDNVLCMWAVSHSHACAHYPPPPDEEYMEDDEDEENGEEEPKA